MVALVSEPAFLAPAPVAAVVPTWTDLQPSLSNLVIFTVFAPHPFVAKRDRILRPFQQLRGGTSRKDV